MQLGYSPATNGIFNHDTAFKHAVENNLQFIELHYEPHELTPTLQNTSSVKQLQAATGIRTTVHLPFIDLNIASLSRISRQAAINRIQKGLEYAHSIEASCAVLHSGEYFFYQSLPEVAAWDALRESLSALQGASVPLALENLALQQEHLVKGPEALRALVNEFDMFACLDMGHAFVEGFKPWSTSVSLDIINAYIHALGSRLIHVHIHNNDGVLDTHQATCDGRINYEGHAPFLTSFNGTICIEVAGHVTKVTESAMHLRGLVTNLREAV